MKNIKKRKLMEKRKIIGAGFSIIALVTIGIFIAQTDFSIQLQSYFSLEYCMQFVPLIISLLLLFGGVFLFINRPNANFALALFGYAALEEILFDWLGVASTYLSTYSIVLFFCCAIAALWIAHSNSFNLKRLSYRELIFSVVFGAVESLLPNFL
ncbi:MAG: hypothetical protein DHS20C18_49390 [Saprospiraceae bacterium]|nr:MAG: hypothetical protein DHS20C18_49390 [Saprospiraceae bacterium]